MRKIPLSRPFINDLDKEYMLDSLSREKISGDGYYTKKVNEFIENTFHTRKSFLTTSCSSALDIAAMLLDLKNGDEVILPTYTFTSTANAVLLRGATPVFVDIEADTLNIDIGAIRTKITPKTKAIFPIHYAGISCEMDTVMEIAEEYNLKVVEDAAQGVNAKYKDRYLGTIGDIGTYSFHESKNFSCGEGGALLINNDTSLIKKAEIIREKGTNRSMFFRGEVDKYTWVDIGSSYLLADILAAILFAQFQKMEEITHKREIIYSYYYKHLQQLEDQGILRLPVIPDYCKSNYHIFYILLNSEEERNYLMKWFKEKGIIAPFHYVPLHISPLGKKLGYKKGDLPRAEDLSSRLLRLPLYVGLIKDDLDYIIELLYKIYQ